MQLQRRWSGSGRQLKWRRSGSEQQAAEARRRRWNARGDRYSRVIELLDIVKVELELESDEMIGLLKPTDISDENITSQRSVMSQETHAREKFREVKIFQIY